MRIQRRVARDGVVTTSAAGLFMSTVYASGSLADDGSRVRGLVAGLVGVGRREVGTFGRDASSSMSTRDDGVCFDDDDDDCDDWGVTGGRKRGREREVVF